MLSEMMTAGVDRVRLVFGPEGDRVPGAELLAAGERRFSHHADSDTIGMLMTNDRCTAELTMAAIAAGVRVVSLPLPGRGVHVGVYAAFIRDVCSRMAIAEIVVADEYADLLEGIGQPARRHSSLGERPLAAPSSDGFRLVQFTSGSTGPPRPVAVDDASLGANIEAILAVVQPQPGDSIVSWLPLAHDMGLVGMLLTGLVAAGPRFVDGGDIILMDPTTFLRDPTVWLESLDRWRGTFTAAPDFGYRLATRRSPSRHIDLSSLRCAIVGGEVVRAETLTSFVSTFRGNGLSPQALCPAYGMAEMCLAVTLTSPGESWRTRTVSSSALADSLISEPRNAGDELVLVASGRPLPNYEVAGPSSEVETGELAVRGPSIGNDAFEGTPLGDKLGWYKPGDTGFIEDEWVYVAGRTDDYVVANGRNIYAPSVEAAVGVVDGLRTGRVTVFGLDGGQWVIAAEPVDAMLLDPDEMDRLGRAMKSAAVGVSSAKPDAVILVEAGALPLTSSGKLQRKLVRHRFVAGDLPVVHRA